jgi:hypothetical protein
MRIRQYVYFGIASQKMTPDEVSTYVGLPADEARPKGPNPSNPARVSRYNWWMVVCREPGLQIDEQLARVVTRLEGLADKIADVVKLVQAEGDGSGPVLRIVRYFDDPEGEEEIVRRMGDLESLSGQHQLLGWHIDQRVIDFLARTGAYLDADEYG